LVTKIEIENCESPFCVIHAKEITPGIQNISDKISAMDENGKTVTFNGWDGDYCTIVKPSEVYRIFSQEKKVFIETEKDVLQLKLRLYEAEDFLSKNGLTDFIRISNTDIINFSNASRLDLSLSGIIKVVLKNENQVQVSRRYMGKIRSELCLK